MGRDRTRIERLEQLNNSSTVSDVTGTAPIVVTTPSVGVRNIALSGTTGGTVTSVGLTMPAEFSVANSPVTSSGTLAATWANETANTLLAGPTTGAAATPAFRAMVTADIPNNAVTLAKLATQADKTVLANISGGAAVPTASGLSAIIDNIIGSTQGQILYRDASVWNVLSPGTKGQVLTTGGASANPAWSAINGVFAGLTVPVTSNFSTFGSVVTATDCTTPPRLKFSLNGAAGANLGGLVQASISAPYTIDLAFANMSNVVQNTQSTYIAIVLADSGATPKYRAFGIGGINLTISWVLDSWTGTATDVRASSGQVGGQSVMYLRVTNDTTTLRYYLSADGLSFSQVASEAVNTFVTPTKFGIGATNGATPAMKYDIFNWVVSNSVLGDAA